MSEFHFVCSRITPNAIKNIKQKIIFILAYGVLWDIA